MPIDQALSAQPSSNPISPQAPPAAQGVQSPNDAAGPGLKFAQDLLALHQAKQNSAMSEMEKNMKAAEAGFPIDTMHLAKLAKKAGLHIDTSPEAIAAFISERTGNTKGGHPQNGPDPTAGGNTLQPPKGMGMQQPGQGGQGQPPPKMSKEQMRSAIANEWAQNAVAAAHKRGESAEKVAQLQTQVTDLKLQAINGTPEQQRVATGKLMGINEIPFTMDRATWNAASPEQRGHIVDIAAGHESDAQFQVRSTGIMQNMLASGRFTDPAAAQQAADALAKGLPIPAEAQAKMKPYTMTELTQQATQAVDFIQLGVAPKDIPRVMGAAAAGGLAYALPTGLNPLMLQELNVRKEQLKVEQQRANTEAGQVNVEQQRAQAEQTRADADARRADAAAALDENKEFFASFQALVSMAKTKGITIPKEVTDSYIAQLAERSGMDVGEAKHWWQYITGGTYMTFTPKSASGVAQAAAGKSPNAPDGSPNKTTPGKNVDQHYKSTTPAAAPVQQGGVGDSLKSLYKGVQNYEQGQENKPGVWNK